MAVARKSDVSATDSGLQAPVSRNGRQRRAAHRQKSSVQLEKAPRTKYVAENLSLSARQRSSEPPSTKTQTTLVPELSKQKASKVPVMPSAEAVPSWLLRLYTLHHHSSIVAFLLVATTLVVYGWTVYSQQLWSQSYRKLQNLQRHERQLMTTNEVLKNKMAQEAERPSAKLVSPTPSGMIFWNSTPAESKLVPNTKPTEIPQQTPYPVGY